MNNNGGNFELAYKGSNLKVQEHQVAGQTIFRIVFPDSRKPLVVTRATRSNYTDFWTSVPEGRQQEAEEIGALISEYLTTKAN
ncbi:hypothetical protein FC093_21600 [Ilyomonas limi]|uniref:Uncharacterized protein n=1 Tax=Ilyomonas limi TaxID=2575867 RepID=A0A4U3KRJ1_9BACT|nr:hypothetical protein [Ilyomonas limi]TKK64851.1 hypothetical protein FC093_21600 [Ilyomonas limi]